MDFRQYLVNSPSALRPVKVDCLCSGFISNSQVSCHEPNVAKVLPAREAVEFILKIQR